MFFSRGALSRFLGFVPQNNNKNYHKTISSDLNESFLQNESKKIEKRVFLLLI